MKYGDTLRQRSIPEWGHYNIDYDYLKDLIKHQTTPGTNKAVSIPGQGETTERAFGDTFFKVLKAQHDRINLFIRSKAGEIERRLEHIGRSLEQLEARRSADTPGAQLPAKTVEKYAKIDADVSKAGEEIRSLSRFQVAQRTGFRKILKKYRRWTRDRELEHRLKEVSCSPESFFQLDLGYLLDQYIDVLGALRAPFDGPGLSSPPTDSAKTPSSASRISKAIGGGSELDFDLALSTVPLGSHGSKATYWVHPDHIVEVQVLLLQHMRLYTSASGRRSSTLKDTPNATPGRRKSSATPDRYFGNEDNIGFIVLDLPESFAIKQNASTIGASEEAPGTLGSKAAGNARWTSCGDAVVVVGLESQGGHDLEKSPMARLRRKYIEAFLDTSIPFSNEPDAELEDESYNSQQGIVAARGWLADNKNIKPIAGICSKRTRFLGLHNSVVGGIWATLDRDIFIKGNMHENLKNDEWAHEARSNSIGFPHAILEIRREGIHAAGLVQTLDRSHLVERVRGFSLEAHAVWTCCKPSAMSAPFWIPLLDQDIRKLPAPVKRQRRKAGSMSGSYSHISPPQTSTSATSLTDGQMSPFTPRNGESSATSAPELDPPPLQAFKKKSRKPYSDYPPPMRAATPPENQRYWNEYDNPESEDEGYYIYVDPDAVMKFPGQDFLVACVATVKKLFGHSDAAELSPLLSPTDYGSSDEDETANDSAHVASKNYGTLSTNGRKYTQEGYFSTIFRSLQDPHRDAEMRRRNEFERRSLLDELHLRQHKTEMTKLRFYMTCLATATVINIILGIMTTTSRRKERGIVDGAILFGTICTLLLCGVAILSMRTRRENLSILHQGFVMVVVGAIIAVDVLLLRWVLSA